MTISKILSVVFIFTSLNCFAKDDLYIDIVNKEKHSGAFHSYFQIKDSDGQPFSEEQLEETHTKKLHVFIVDESLNEYHHLHPEYAEDDKTFIVKFKPKSGLNYKLWTEFKLDGENHSLQTDLISNWKDVYKNELNGYRFELHTEQKIVANELINFEVLVTSAKNKKIKLQKILGANAHITCFSQDGKSMIHVHESSSSHKHNLDVNSDKVDSDDEDKKSLSDAGIVESDSSVKFALKPSKAGFYKIFIQMKIDGKEITSPFIVQALED